VTANISETDEDIQNRTSTSLIVIPPVPCKKVGWTLVH